MTLRRAATAAAPLAGLLALALAARLWAFGGVTFAHLGDDGRYVAVARNLANGFAPEGASEWFGGRVAFLWPVAGLFHLLGADDRTAVAWPLAGSLLAVAAAWLLGRELGGARTALVAGGIVALAPLELLMATRLRPDALMAAFVAMAVWAGLRAARTPRGVGWGAAAGVLLGCAWSVREMALVMVPVVVGAGWRAGRRPLIAGVAGFAGVGIAAVAATAAVGGDPLMPLRGTAGASEARSPLDAWSWDASYLHTLLTGAVHPRTMTFLLLPVLLAAVAVLAATRDRRAVLPGAWLAWAAFYLEIGTLPNLVKSQRFLLVASIPAALLVALAVERWGTWPSVAAVAAVGAAAFLALQPVPGREHRAVDVVLLDRVAGEMHGLPPGPVLAESHTWWAKLNAYLARDRLTVPVADDPAFMTASERAARDRLEPLPALEDYRGGYVVRAPVEVRPGWPANWGLFRRQVRTRVPWDRLVPVAQVGRATVYRWPDDLEPLR